MEILTNKNKMIKNFLIFLGFMLICTFISKSIYVSRLPRISVRKAEKKSIEHVVEAEGIIKQGKDIAVYTKEGLRVKELFVRVGDQIEEGSPLFSLDKDEVEEVIEKKKLEIAELEFQIKDLNSNQSLEDQKKQQSTERANVDYQTTQEKADLSKNRAQDGADQAAKNLEKHLQSGVSVTPNEERDRQREAYQSWRTQLSQKEEEIAGKQTELANAEAALLQAVQQEEAAAGSVNAAQEAVTLAQEELENAQTPEEQAAAAAKLEEANKTLESAKAGQEAAALQAQAAKEQAEAVKQQLEESQAAYEALKQQAVNEPDFSGEDSARQSWEKEKNALEQQKKQAEYTREEAIITQEDAIREAGRKVEDSQAADKEDSTMELYQMRLKQLQKELEEYRVIYRADGIITGNIKGTITQILVSVGQKTTDTAAIVCADMTVPFQLDVMIDKEDKKYVQQNDEVKVTAGSMQKELKIDYMEESTASPGSYRALVYLPEGMGALGMSGTIQRSDQSDNYPCCVPVAAVHKDGERYFLYVLSERDGILGKELYAHKRYVRVLDQNDTYAALAKDSLSDGEEVIVETDKELKDDQVVRPRENRE